jgi:hypothetical protein
MNPDIAVGLCFEYFHNWTIMLKAVSLYTNGDIGYRLRASSRRSLTLNDGLFQIQGKFKAVFEVAILCVHFLALLVLDSSTQYALSVFS